MLIRNIDQVERTPVDMEGVVGATMAMMCGRGDGAPHFALRQFQVEPGGHTPRHRHDYEHEVYIVSGRGEVLLDGAYRPIRAGDVILVPADEEHQFRTTGGDENEIEIGNDEPLRFLCIVPVERNCGGPTPGS